jgi:hypothetical protein
LTLTPTTGAFGAVAIGSQATVPFEVRNVGGEPTGALSATVTGAGFVATANGCQGMTLAPNATCSVTVGFSPTSAASFLGELRVTGSPGGDVAASLSGSGAQSTFTLTVVRAGTGTGTIIGTGIDCGGDCGEAVAAGATLVLTATAASGSTFGNWSGCDSLSGAGGNVCTVTVSGNRTVTATFDALPSNFTLTVARAGSGTGTVTGTGVDCGADCAETVPQGTQVSLTATASSGSTFAGWSGCDSTSGPSGNVCSVTVTAHRTVTATFTLVAQNFLLTVAHGGTGSGTVTGMGIACGTDCTESLPSGTQVTLTATAAGGSTFGGWTGCDSTSGAGGSVCTVTLTAPRTVTAAFTLAPQNEPLTVARAGTGTGTVTGPGITCGTDCAESVPRGTQVSLTATAAVGSLFGGWSGCDSTSGAGGSVCVVTLMGPRTVTATFTLAPNYLLTVAKTGSGSGTVTGTGISCGADCTESVPAGTQVSLTATASGGSVFTSWAGCDSLSGAGNSVCAVTVTAARTVTATFTSTAPPSHTFTGGSLAALRAISPSLTFTDLTFTGTLDLTPADGSAITIQAATITLNSGGNIDFSDTTCPYSAPPSVTLTASTSIALNGGSIYLWGAGGSRLSSCSCDGVRGGNVTLTAPTVTVGTGTSTQRSSVSVYGGFGSYMTVGSNTFGCNGGAGGTITINGSTAITANRYHEFRFEGGSAGTGAQGNGTAGANGRITFAGAVASVYERRFSDGTERNALAQNAMMLTYQRFDLLGGVNQDDDVSYAGQNGSVTIGTDFCEDLFVILMPTAGTLQLGLTSTQLGDKDLYLINSALTMVLASSNGPTSTENISYSAAAGRYVVCVNWAADNPIGSTSPSAYTLRVGP